MPSRIRGGNSSFALRSLRYFSATYQHSLRNVSAQPCQECMYLLDEMRESELLGYMSGDLNLPDT